MATHNKATEKLHLTRGMHGEITERLDWESPALSAYRNRQQLQRIGQR